MKNCAMLAVLAGVLAGGAFANDPDATNMQAIEAKMPQAGYSSRLNQVVYGTTLTAGDWRSRGGAYKVGARFSFTPGPASSLDTIVTNAWAWAMDQAVGTSSAPSTSEYVLSLKYYIDPAAGPAVSPTALPAVPDVTLNIGLANFCTPGYITFYPAPVGLVDANNLPISLTFNRLGATDGIKGFFVAEVFNIDGVTPSPDVGASLRGLAAPTTGSSDGVRWADADRNGLFVAAEAFGALNNYRTVYHQIQGDAPPPPAPTGTTELGCLTDAGLSQTYTLAANETKWYKFCINGDATDSAGQFLSIDSEGSAFGASAGVYNLLGNLVGVISSDDDSGSGTNFQLSYGHGLHASAGGDGKQYDGINGEMFAGEYYVAVTGDAGSFGGSFNASGAHAGGDVTINFATNTNGGALPTAVEPTVRAGNDLGILSDPGAPGSTFTLPRYGTDWYRFELEADIAAPTYLDIDFSASGTSIADPQARLFDASGNALFESDDAGVGYTRPQFSFGDVGPRTQGSSPVPFDGSTAAVLPAGTYYLATSLFAQTNSALGRWHVRSNSGSSLSYQADFYVGTGGGCGCAADYNQDGGVDGGDVEAFFNDWSSSIGCADVNIDGGIDGGDVEAFFIVWSNGGC